MGELPPTLRRPVEHFLGYLKVERGLADNTVAAYRRDVAGYAHYLHSRSLTPASSTENDIRAWMRALASDAPGRPARAASSVARALAAVRSFHRFLDEESGDAVGNPSTEVESPARPLRLPHPIPVHEVEALIDAAGRERGAVLSAERALRDRALVELLYGVGARISEAIGADIDDLDLDSASILLRGKGNKERVVPVGRYACEALSAYITRGRPSLARKGNGSPAIFLGSRGTRLTRQAAWSMIQQAAEEAEISEPISPHTLRHSYATHLLQGGADVRTVQELLGHASVSTTQLYTQVTVDSLRETHALAHPRARGREGS